MENAMVIRGHQTGPKQIELDEALATNGRELAIIVLPLPNAPAPKPETIFEFLRRLPPGTRTKEDIDRQIAEERDWGPRHADLP